MPNMPELDLHGVQHHQVDRIVENFVLMSDLPARIITGNSMTMHQMVRDVLSRHDLKGEYENHWNLGAVIVKQVM